MLDRLGNTHIEKQQHYIDKTEGLEKGIAAFPSIYIEGAAGIGKTVAVRMLLEKRPEIGYRIIDAGKNTGRCENGNLDFKTLEAVMRQMEKEEREYWLIVENINGAFSGEMGRALAEFVIRMPANGRVIFVGRERPDQCFLKLYWEKRLELISKEMLLFSREEIEEYCIRQGTSLLAAELYEVTGGWAGCVDNMIRLAVDYEKHKGESIGVSELRKTYEIDGYIQQEILGTLPREEYQMMQRGRECPWLNETLCEEVWKFKNAGEIIEKLERKGILEYKRQPGYWKLSSLFQYISAREDRDVQGDSPEEQKRWQLLAEWYEQNHYIREALICAKAEKGREWYRDFIIRNYTLIPHLGIEYGEVLVWKEKIPQLCYLRGMYYYSKRDFQGLEREIARLEKQQSGDRFLKQEILLNLYYLKPGVNLEDWLSMLKEGKEAKEIKETREASERRYRLYNILGNAHTYLCGLRDLTGLFACTKKEENAKAKIWKSRLGAWEWKCYQLARIDYYLETERRNALRKEDFELLWTENVSETEEALTDKPIDELEENPTVDGIKIRRFNLVRLYLLCKMRRLDPEADYEERISILGNQLIHAGEDICRKNAEVILNLYAPWRNNPERLTRWLRYSENDTKEQISETNYFQILCMAKGYLLVNQYEKAQRILKHMIPYLRDYGRWKLLSEIIFEQALVNWEQGSRGQALQNVIEAFIINGKSRCVDCYASYGKRAEGLLEAYAEWLKGSAPEGWHRKKKYQYGNVLRMPVEDYIQVIMRCARREARTNQPFAEEAPSERLTMMETIILQDIGRGLSNNEICAELNLKLPTVKSHIYSLYKKLGANSRVQAVLKGKEMGILR